MFNMLAEMTSTEPPSLLVCGSLIPNPDDAYLSRLRSSLIHSPCLADLREGIAELPHLWPLLVAKQPSLHRVGAAPLLQSLAQWVTGGNSCALSMAGQTSRNTLLAVLTVLVHILEFTTYLNSHEEDRDAHASTLEGVREGGVQGLCVGLLSAIALACSKDRTEVGKHGAIALRLALCVGAVVDLDEMESPQSIISLSARWPRGEGHEAFEAVLEGYQQAYMGVRMDKGSATITAPEGTAMALMRHLEEKGAAVKEIDVRGRFHHRGHYAAFQRLADLCATLPILQFPPESRPLVPLRRNDGGQMVTNEVPLHEMALRCILVEQADWYATMTSSMAAMAQGTSEGKARVLVLGPVDCVPRSALAICPLQVVRSLPNVGYPDDSIAIIGTSCRFPHSETPEGFWDTIRDRKTGTCLAAAGSFDCSLFRKSPREAEYMDPQHRLALHLAYEALESGGHFSPSSSATDKVGCYVGISSCDYEEEVNAQAPTAFSFTGTARAFASGRISHFFGLTGPSMVLDTACSSSAVAIHTASRAIQAGECSVALAGGVNLMTAQARSHQNLAAASFLSPTGQCRPFDAAANGYSRGEGGGFVLLRKLSAAVADDDCIMGVLGASAINSSKGSRSITLPSSESQSQLYRCVLEKAGLLPHHVSYVEAHGTGTQKGDPVESQSIRQVFGGRLRSAPLRLGSVKGNIGHSEAASGLAAVVKVLMMLRHRQMPPQANFAVLNPAIPSLEEAKMEMATCLGPWEGPFRAALVNNYGASGTNAAMIVCQAPPSPSRRTLLTERPCRYPMLISAHSAASLRQYCQKFLDLIDARHGALGHGLLPSVAFCLAQRQNHSHSHRIVFSASSTDDLKNELSSLVQGTAPTAQNGPKPVVLIFAGQTGRRARLSHAAYHDSVLLQRHLDQCDRTLQTLGLTSLFPRVFETEPIDDLVDLHCLLFSLQYSVAKSWLDAGLEVKAIVGHSLGQLTALCVSGVLGLRDALRMISGRAMLMQRNWGSDRGCMLSVDADAASVLAIAQSLPRGAGIEVACYNSPTHHVVVGTEAAVTAYEDAARSRDVAFKRLSVTHGFHSEMVNCIMQEYHRLIQGLVLHRPTITIEPCSSSSGSWDNITPELIARQSREPVYFADAVARVEQRLGPCVWLEAGSGSAGITMARRALSAPVCSPHSFHSARLGDLDPVASLTDTTLGLWREGVRVHFWLYHASQRCYFEPLELPPYQFEKSNHWLPVTDKVKESQDKGETVQEEPKLVSLVGDAQDLGANTVEFSINQQSEEYTTFVRGRTVFGHILAPTSVYVESAARAFGLLPMLTPSGNAPPSSVQVGGLKIHAPFGLDLEKRLMLTLRKRTSSSWHFVVESQSRSRDGTQDSKLQATGTVGWQGQERTYLGPQRPLLRRLYDRCEQLREDRSASVVQGAFVNKILGRVASYADSYFGIRSITSKGLEAVGDVVMPAVASQCCAETVFSPPVFDNFLLIAELHASSLGDLADDRTYICNGFDAIVPQLHPQASDSEGPWTVLSTLDREDEKTILCDIFVFAAGHKTLSLAIMGARLVQIPLASLQRALEGLNGAGNVKGAMASNNLAEKLPRTTWGSSTDATSASDDVFGTQHIKSNPPRATTDLHIDLSNGQMRQCSRRGSLSTTSRLTPTDDGKDGDSFDAFTKQSLLSAGSSASSDGQATALYNLLKDHLDCAQGLSHCTPLGAIGLDSLVAIQLQSDIEKMFGKRASPMIIDENTTFSDLCGMVLCPDLASQPEPSPLPMTTAKSKPNAFTTRAALDFGQVKRDTGLFAQRAGFAGFFLGVYPKQTLLVLAYISEAFSSLGCNLSTLREGDELPRVRYTPKHERLVSRFHEILEQAGLISRPDCRAIYSRTGKPVLEDRTAAELYRDLLVECPCYRPDHQLLNVTGPRLGDCLSGLVDPLQLLFQDEASVRLLQDVYVSSPMFATGNEMLGELISRLVSNRQDHKLRIVEVGAGTGATTQIVLDKLLASNVDFAYTFTDVSVALIAGARRKLEAKYGQQKMRRHVEFAPLDMEKSPPANMVHSYDLIITSNCIHATRNLRQSCANMEALLRRDGGMLCLLELTRPLSWLDCVFGLLDGWWRFDDGRTYALAGEYEWEERLREAGFHHVDWTDDGTQESQQFRLITAWR